MDLPHRKILSVLREAYRPCAYFGTCREAVWNPAQGHVPRGFVGATGDLAEVELVMVFSEPGHPHPDESYAMSHNTENDADGPMERGIHHTYRSFRSGMDQFHRNARWFLDQLYPDLSFDHQLRHVWLTEGRLCSITNEIGTTRDRTCAAHYLTRQLALVPNATVVAFGGKAQHYLKGLGIARIDAYALAPPGANHAPARPSWKAAIAQVRARRTNPAS